MSSSIPTSLKAGPTTTNTLVVNRDIFIYILLIWISIFPEIFIIFKLLSVFEISLYFFLVLLPLYLFFGYFLLVFSSIWWAWLFLKIIFLFHRPREGYFERTRKNKDYRFWSLRAVVKKFPIWVCHNFPVPWADSIALKMFGDRVALSTPTYDAWIDSEFLEIGHGTIIGQGSIIMTSMITTELLIIKKVKIGKDCLIGAHSVISPGTLIGDNTILGALSSTSFSQELESGWVYMGTPAIKYRPNEFREKDSLTAEERAKKKPIQEVEDVIAEHSELKGRKTPITIYQLKKTEFKDRRAQKLREKARLKREKALKRLERAEWKAERQEYKAEIKHKQSLMALETAKRALEKKIQKEREKLSKIEKIELEKSREERDKEQQLAIILGIKEKLFQKYNQQQESKKEKTSQDSNHEENQEENGEKSS
ncbi:DapH/DapD/GlmU-related protein [Candidatus Harpocratesius sp.]